MPENIEGKLPKLPCCPSIDEGGGGSDSKGPVPDPGFIPPTGQSPHVFTPSTRTRSLGTASDQLHSQAGIAENFRQFTRLLADTPVSRSYQRRQAGDSPRTRQRSESHCSESTYDTTRGYFVQASTRRVSPSGGDQQDAFVIPPTSGKLLLPDRLILETIEGPTWRACGEFWWYVWLSVPDYPVGEHSWIIQHVRTYAQFAKCPAKDFEPPETDDYYEAFMLDRYGRTVRGTTTPIITNGVHDREACETAFDKCNKVVQHDFGMGVTEGFHQHGWDKFSEPGRPQTCGFWRKTGELYWVPELSKSRTGWRPNNQKIKAAGSLPSRRSFPPELEDAKMLATHYAECQWDCCCDPFLKGSAGWRVVSTGRGELWSADKKGEGDATTIGPKEWVDERVPSPEKEEE